MSKLYVVKIFEFIDYELINDKSHVSISGGIATHSFNHIGNLNFKTIKEFKSYMTDNHSCNGNYTFDNDDHCLIMYTNEEHITFNTYIKVYEEINDYYEHITSEMNNE